MATGRPTRELTRTDFRGRPCRPLGERAPYKADLLLYQVDGEPVLLKDYGGRPGPWGRVLGPILSRREARALRALDGLSGVPRLRGKPDRYSLAMTFFSGSRARSADPALRGNEAFVRELEELVRRIHARGVVHLDLKHRSNLLVSDEGHPVVLDFESAVCVRPDSWLGRGIVALLGQLDWLAVQNWKRRLCPHLLAQSRSDRRRARLARKLRGAWLPRRVLDVFFDILMRRPDGRNRGG